ncbi:MAG: IPTL-CTERM sorting domain-containing protein [Desulfobacterales bacterium]|nr:IPTL-CTERM sorting domain-containing protein [Desulfobacterales bacterium]
MKKEFFTFLTIVTALLFFNHGISEAAHFSVTGTSNIDQSSILSMTQFQWCNHNNTHLNMSTTIDADGSEQIGDPVTIHYCYSVTVTTTSINEDRYIAIAGVGDSSSFSESCLPYPPAYIPSSGPATLVLNPGPSQNTIISYGPQVVEGNANVSVIDQCGTFSAHIGDTLQGDAGAFLLLYDNESQTNPDSGGSASIIFNFFAEIESNSNTSVPTMTEWGIIILSLLLAGSAIWMIKRRRIA